LPKHVDTADVEALVEKGAQLVEVLPAESYATEHLPGARNIPMAKLDARTIAQLDRVRPQRARRAPDRGLRPHRRVRLRHEQGGVDGAGPAGRG
jgi:rhodanese-related sulfurtransferase